MKTIGTLCALLLCAVSATAQDPAPVATPVPPAANVQGPAQTATNNAAPAARRNAAADLPVAGAAPGVLETGLLIVSRDWPLEAHEYLPQIQITSPFQPRSSPQPQEGFQWRSAMEQWATFLTWQHSVRLFEEKTHSQLGGPFVRDYARSVKGLGGWWDGDSRRTNYLGHPMMGAISGYIQIQNDPGARFVQFGRDRAYWRSRAKAFAAAAIYSTQFELGPMSEASIGNVGMKPGTMGFVDLVMTPLGALSFIVAEDAIDRYVIAKAEPRIGRAKTRFLRTVLTPNRSLANIVRFQAPWHRDSRDLPPKGGPRTRVSDAAGRDGAGVNR